MATRRCRLMGQLLFDGVEDSAAIVCLEPLEVLLHPRGEADLVHAHMLAYAPDRVNDGGSRNTVREDGRKESARQDKAVRHMSGNLASGLVISQERLVKG